MSLEEKWLAATKDLSKLTDDAGKKLEAIMDVTFDMGSDFAKRRQATLSSMTGNLRNALHVLQILLINADSMARNIKWAQENMKG